MINQTNIKKAAMFAIALFMAFFSINVINAQSKKNFKVIAFYTGRNDLAHISFMHEANRWFPAMAKKYNFTYDSTNNWANMNPEFLAKYQVVIFLDTRADNPEQRAAFEQYMKKGGAWMGFHFSAFALTPSDFPQNWDWYHNEFLGSGQYVSNTWHPTPAVLHVEDPNHPVTKGLPVTFKTNPNEWYRWEHDLRKNPNIDILLAVDSTSFPLGTGPKQYEIWHSGYYPVAWTNKNYRMVYFNIGHNAMDYDGGTNKELSQTFENADVDKLIINSLLWLGRGK
ncbi:Trehalose utilisation [Mucilaginibacter gossypiicola]|uniref:Trehalose utilisation n=1 Tax=Mucilaginibacter gossypiicola TaxID=551995 RepID=A0A1H8RS71_9SPHI|nr:ThuA domain-containing protein [Mucilaginibacter gossypiicola]SEO69469.1 Trehalose utilisation [Mucilaginibacter gossypiicola]